MHQYHILVIFQIPNSENNSAVFQLLRRNSLDKVKLTRVIVEFSFTFAEMKRKQEK